MAPVPLDPVQELPRDVTADPDLGLGGRRTEGLRSVVTALPFPPILPFCLPSFCPPLPRSRLVPFAPHPLVPLGPLDVVDGVLDLILPCRYRRLTSTLLNPYLHPLRLDPFAEALLLPSHDPAAPGAAEALPCCLHQSVTPLTPSQCSSPLPEGKLSSGRG